MSADGSVVVGVSAAAAGLEAFRWTETTGMVGLGTLGGKEYQSTAAGVSADGSIVVGASSSAKSGSNNEAFLWTEETGMVGLGDLPGGDFSSGASGISADGSVIVGTSDSRVSNIGEAFLWTASTGLVGLGVPDETHPVAASAGDNISADGRVVVGSASTANGLEAFRWTETEGFVLLGDLPGGLFFSKAREASADGSVVVGSAVSAAGPTGFRWTAESGMVAIGSGDASAVSDDGRTIVGDAGLDGDTFPTIWDEEHGMRNLVDVLVELGLSGQMTGWDLERAEAISADGLAIAGWGYNPEGGVEAWVAYLGQPSVLEIPSLSRHFLVAFALLLAVTALVVIRSR
jgi:probable HAF family extracellular repeat protein